MACGWPARRGESRFLPEQNLSYKTAALAPFGSAIERLMAPDFVLHEELRARGARMFVEANAVVAHENFNDFRGPWRAHFNYMRLLSARRADRQGWSHSRRLAYGVAVLAASLALVMWRRYAHSRTAGARARVPRGPAGARRHGVVRRRRRVDGLPVREGDERAIHHWSWWRNEWTVTSPALRASRSSLPRIARCDRGRLSHRAARPDLSRLRDGARQQLAG
jgi:hypothetical protein